MTSKEKIDLISSYFNVSTECASYMYFRRRRGYPFKKSDDQRYIAWDMEAQNTLVRLDNEEINWDDLQYQTDLEQIRDMGISFDVPKHKHIVNPQKEKKEESSDGWTTVNHNEKREKKAERQQLRRMGFIERDPNERKVHRKHLKDRKTTI